MLWIGEIPFSFRAAVQKQEAVGSMTVSLVEH